MSQHTRIATLLVAGLILASLPTGAAAEDWPTYRHDHARSNATGEQLSAPLAPQWTFLPLHAPQPAWSEPAKEKPRVRFDEAFHVAAVGDAVFFGSSADGKVYCLDAATGAVRWTFITNGPIRVAPTVVDGRVYIGSDDGNVYCLQASDGAEVWRSRASFADDKVLGAGKMTSLWPIRTGVLVDNGVAYFGAGVFPNETTFVCAVDAKTGARLWCNDSFGQKGYSLEFGGISPQGALLASDSTLFVPSGRAMPAAFSRDTGDLLYYCPPGGKVGGTWALLTGDRLVAGMERKHAYDTATGRQAHDNAYAWFPGLQLVVTDKHAYTLMFDELAAMDRGAFQAASEWRNGVVAELDAASRKRAPLDKKARAGTLSEAEKEQLRVLKTEMEQLTTERKRIEDGVFRWRRPCTHQDALILAGDTLFAGGESSVSAVHGITGQDLWSAPVNGKACGLAVANQRLFVSTETGAIQCFASGDARDAVVKQAAEPLGASEGRIVAAAEAILEQTGIDRGFCLVYGCGDGRLAYELAKRSDLYIVGVDDDPAAVAKARENFDGAGLLGVRGVFDVCDLNDLPYADYFANLIVSQRMMGATKLVGNASELVRVLKPCGGTVCIDAAIGDPAAWPISGSVIASSRSGDDNLVTGVRGALEGSGSWTHQYADVANTACSGDELVQGPLGVLWYGRPGPENMVERHARPAAPVAMDGRMFVQGENVVMAYDSYNGLELWRRAIPGALRARVDSDMSNMAVQPDGLYVATETECFRLDPATGDVMLTYSLPKSVDGKARRWGYLACHDGILYGTLAEPLTRPYGQAWWAAVTGESENRPDVAEVSELLVAEKDPNPRDFWSFEQRGKMWHGMTSWPAWGSVASPVGAVTERIMGGDAFFALDAATGDLLWRFDGDDIAHPAITIGDGAVFLADCTVTPTEKDEALAGHERLIEAGAVQKSDTHYNPKDADVRRVVALDARTGEKQWEHVVDLTECGGDRMGMAHSDGLVLFLGCFSNHDRNLFNKGTLKWRRITALNASDGVLAWSKPLNYLRRPVIVGDEILIEPRACDVRTGAVKKRIHPLTGRDEEWEYVRPGHCCSATSASANMFFLRGYFLWYYDLKKDQGMLPFGGIRPGCWINTVPADGVLLFPEASAGCTCSYPIRSTVVMHPKKQQTTWAMCVQYGDLTPVKQMAVNLGAPGDWRDADGAMWFGYPHPPSTSWHPYGVDFRLKEKFIGESDYTCRSFQGETFADMERPWLYASSARGLTKCEVPLLEEGQGPARYTVRLHFVETEVTAPKTRVFEVRLQGKRVQKNLDIFREAGGANIPLVKEFTGVKVDKDLVLELLPRSEEPGPDQVPILSGIEVIREEFVVAAAG
ncbi:MAG: PQQ-binding-like beta-propeller repeat protein [bacterium]|nr:PQQ-binding-like beta-propeller repeat protein [bacterium]